MNAETVKTLGEFVLNSGAQKVSSDSSLQSAANGAQSKGGMSLSLNPLDLIDTKALTPLLTRWLIYLAATIIAYKLIKSIIDYFIMKRAVKKAVMKALKELDIPGQLESVKQSLMELDTRGELDSVKRSIVRLDVRSQLQDIRCTLDNIESNMPWIGGGKKSDKNPN